MNNEVWRTSLNKVGEINKAGKVCSPGREPLLTKNKEFKTCLVDKLYQ